MTRYRQPFTRPSSVKGQEPRTFYVYGDTREELDARAERFARVFATPAGPVEELARER